MTSRPDRPGQVLIQYVRGEDGTLRKRVRRLPRGARMAGASAPWVWRTLQAARPGR